MRKIIVLFIIFSVLMLSSAFGAPPRTVGDLPIFPGAQGFGTGTLGGYGAPNPPLICVVTTTNPTAVARDATRNGVPVKTGGLKTLVDLNPGLNRGKLILFEISGNIDLGGNRLTVDYPYTSILGSSAPSPGITLKSAHLVVTTHDVFIQHLRIRPGDEASWKNCDNVRAITMEANYEPVYNVVIDHCSLSWGIDTTLSVWETADDDYDISMSNNIISEPLANSCHSKGIHARAVQLGDKTERLTLYRNLIAHARDRCPSLNNYSAQVINNVIYNSYNANIKYDEESANPTITIRGNYVKRGPNSSSYAGYGVLLKDSVTANAKIYVDDLISYNCSKNYSTPCNPVTQGIQIEGDPKALVSSEPSAVSTAKMTIASALNLMNEEHKDYLFRTVGARAADRDVVDLRVIHDVIYGTGNYIDSQSEVGGWPVLKVNTRNLESMENPIPSSPHADDDGDGYTNLENWIIILSRMVESTISTPKNVTIDQYTEN